MAQGSLSSTSRRSSAAPSGMISRPAGRQRPSSAPGTTFLSPFCAADVQEDAQDFHILSPFCCTTYLEGYCREDKELLLVYEFMAKGSLENHLFMRGAAPLNWGVRLKILIGAARGLAFLHNSVRKVIYRDFKASNILQDSHYNAEISDFGLAS